MRSARSEVKCSDAEIEISLMKLNSTPDEKGTQKIAHENPRHLNINVIQRECIVPECISISVNVKFNDHTAITRCLLFVLAL